MPAEEMRGEIHFTTKGGLWGLAVNWGDMFTEPIAHILVARVRETDLGALRKVGERDEIRQAVVQQVQGDSEEKIEPWRDGWQSRKS